MNIIISPSLPVGNTCAIASKSAAHRALICAAFADSETKIKCERTNRDIEATVACLGALGARIEYSKPYFTVSPVTKLSDTAELHCGESGSTMRFLLPIVSALGIKASFVMEGRLPERPLSPLYEELCAHGAILSPCGTNPFICDGKLCTNEFSIRGDVSSQFISGLLFASVLMGGNAKINISGKIESAPYIDMTCDMLSQFGVCVIKHDFGYEIPDQCRLISPGEVSIEGDWSNAAFPLCLGAIGGDVTVCGIDPDSHQGDKRIIGILQKFGANIINTKNTYTASKSNELCGIELDASDIPDLVPVIAAVASVAKGQTRIFGASRLRIKESDRLDAITQALTSLGADITETADGLIINGKPQLLGGTVNTFNDHRIAMSTAVAAVSCTSDVKIIGAECVAKSYPDFWSEIESLGVKITKE